MLFDHHRPIAPALAQQAAALVAVMGHQAGPVEDCRRDIQGTAEVVAHAPGVTRAFQEVTITEVGRGKTSLEALGSRLRTDYDIVSDGLDTFERVRTALVARQGPPRPEAPHDVRVAIMMMR